MIGNEPFKEYIENKESSSSEKKAYWEVSIGLQQVDGLKPSKYLYDVANRNINGEISFDEAKQLINSYYEELSDISSDSSIEADKASINIAKALSDESFVFSVNQYIDIHKSIFDGIFDHAGQIRNINISKKEWVLDGDSVIYGGASLLKDTIEYDFKEEKEFDYRNITKEDFVKHIAKFIANIWQIHLFREGNTRATAVFLIKYLRSFGYKVSNTPFKENSWYFRNALVRANYNNMEKDVFETTEYLELFLRNLLFNENNELKNRYLNINWKNESLLISKAMRNNLSKLISVLGEKEYFGRSDVISVLSISPRGASKIIAALLEKKLIIPVTGHGKGKYKFKNNAQNINS